MIRPECKQCPWRRGDGCLDETKCHLNTHSNTHKANSNTPNALKALDALDLISRQVAIKAIKDLQDCYNGFSDTYDKACIIGILEEVPFASGVITKEQAIKAVETAYWNEDLQEAMRIINGEEDKT